MLSILLVILAPQLFYLLLKMESESFVIVNNVTLYVRRKVTKSDRPTIIFLHDSLGCTELWRDFPDKFSREVNFNFLVYDRQGYGRSTPLPNHKRENDYMEKEADILKNLIVSHNLTPVILFGHSDGGSIAFVAAGKYPSIFEAIIVEAAHVFVEEITLAGIREASNAYAMTNLKSRLEKYHGDKTETLFKAWTETWLSDHFRTWNIEHFLPTIQCPLLFIQGAQDEYGSRRQIEAVAERVKSGVQSCLFTGVNHSPHKEVPTDVIETVRMFLEGIK
jgi:pimeloyl-ACP methyl ester carboxylesterase